MEINISVLETRYIKINVFSGLGDHILVSRAPEFRRKLAQTCACFCSVLRALLNCILNYFFLLILEILVNEADRVAYNFISSARELQPRQPVCPARGFGHRCKIAHGRPDIGLLQRKFEQVCAEIPALGRPICGLQDTKIH